jgi:hypothetical protein
LSINVRETIYERLHAVLTSGDRRVANNRAILQILADTKPDLPSSWVVRSEVIPD